MRVASIARWLALGAAVALAGCTVGPSYEVASAVTPTEYKELKGWRIAKPGDTIERGAWWAVYHDPLLGGFEQQVEISNQTLKESEASFREAQALVQEAKAQFFPTVSLTPGVTRSTSGRSGSGSSSSSSGSSGRSSGPRISSEYTFEANASWEPDVWGKIRRTVESDQAAAQASDADIANAKLSAQATLATDYFQLRAQDALERLLDDTVAEYQRSLKITQNQYNAGTAARSDVITAQTQLLSAQAAAINTGVTRAQFEHAIAVLIGKPPGDFSIPKGDLPRAIPMPPVGLPSTLLERRPDIAASERDMQQENALIGVAIAGYYPNITLSGVAGYAGNPPSALFQASNQVWSVGANAVQSVFDGGLVNGQVKAARANYDQSVATYRQTVLTAFQQVEDQLSNLRILQKQAAVEDAAVKAARQAVDIALNEYKAGTQAYTAVVTAQATALADEETALSIRQQRIVATVALIEALGGGWSMTDLQPMNAF